MKMHCFALALATMALAAPAVAADDQLPSVTVSYDDLNLTSEAGQKRFEARLERAAREVCGMDEPRIGSRLPASGSRKCYREARRKLDQQFAQLVSHQSAGG